MSAGLIMDERCQLVVDSGILIFIASSLCKSVANAHVFIVTIARFRERCETDHIYPFSQAICIRVVNILDDMPRFRPFNNLSLLIVDIDKETLPGDYYCY